ncbi:MAG: hypothetical protein L0227_19470 [Chloroflexi bacterium]|nr:hypothetical protein [Chloroflexota bacterium]
MSRGSDLQAAIRALRGRGTLLERLRGDDPTIGSTFLRGLVAGTLVGAAIAGSTVWQRRRVRGRIRRELAPAEE